MDETKDLLQTILGRLDEVNARMAGLEKGQAEIVERVAALEKGQAELVQRVTSLENGQAQLAERITSVERGLAELRIDLFAFRSETRERLDQLEKRFDYFLDKLARLDEAVWHLKHA